MQFIYYNLCAVFIENHGTSDSKALVLILVTALVCAAIGYFLGSINTGIILSKTKYKDDIRNHGSGNAGATNMLRTHGKTAALITFGGDILKAVISCIAGGLLCGIIGAYVGGLACILGHVFPVYHKFKGGKGVACAAAVIAMTNIKTFVVVIIIFLILVIGTKMVSMGSVMSAVVYPIILFKILQLTGEPPLEYIGVLFAFCTAVIVVVKHKENIKRILNHTESKISFKKKKNEETEKDNSNAK